MNLLTTIFAEILKFFYRYTGDYGIAIVCLTILAKICMLPMQICQRKSMENPQGNPSGCLLLFLQLPIMICLYHSISMGLTIQMGTKLLPWIKSLLVRDAYGILPILSVLVQLIPQTFPYLRFFQGLKLPKPPRGMLVSSAVMTLIICLPLPSGVGIYYFVSGVWSALEQMAWNIWKIQKMKEHSAMG